MSDTIQIPRSEWKSIKNILEGLAASEKANDLVNRDEALLITGLSSKAFSNRKIKPDSMQFGIKYYSRKKLLGL